MLRDLRKEMTAMGESITYLVTKKAEISHYKQ